MAKKKIVEPESPSNQVVVGLNLAHGVAFRLFKDGREYRRVEIKGGTESLRGKEKGIIPVGAFGLTAIDAEDWEEIKRQYGSMRIFKSGLIYAAETRAAAEAEAGEKSELRHGAEPVDTAATDTGEYTKE